METTEQENEGNCYIIFEGEPLEYAYTPDCVNPAHDHGKG